jgi:sulfate transport system ATP-binding protein
MDIRLSKLSKKFGDFVALNEVDLSISKGEFVALLGPSGSGKTTLLRMIAGLEAPDSGQIFFSDSDVTTQSAKQRDIGFIFQHYALFRHLSVYENVAFGLRVKRGAERLTETQISDRVMALLEMVQLDWLKDRFPAQLSGGQKQRVALARTLAIEPNVLLLDEPFGALDTTIRKELRRWLRELHDRLGMTSIFVTHDVDEALEVADKIVVMNHGALMQVGTAEEIYHHPANAFVYQFIGDVNLFHGRVGDHQQAQFIRTDAITLKLSRSSDLDYQGTIYSIRHLGHSYRVMVKTDTQETLEVKLSLTDHVALQLTEGMTVYLYVDPARVFAQDFQI